MEWMDKFSEKERKSFLDYYKKSYERIVVRKIYKDTLESVERWLPGDEGPDINVQCYPREGLMYVDGLKLHVPSYLEKLQLEKVANKTTKTKTTRRL